jgi:hypothetical protein
MVFIPTDAPGDDTSTSPKGHASESSIIETLQKELQKRDQEFNNLLKRLERLEQEVQSLRGENRKISMPTEIPPAHQTRTVQKKESSPVQSPSTLPSDQKEKEEEERLARAVLERVLIQRSALLLPPWTLEIEPSLTYAHSSSDRIVIDGVTAFFQEIPGFGIVLGDIISERVRQDTLIPALTFRLGLPYDFQMETKIPLRYESVKVLRADFDESMRSAFGLGDIEIALSRHLIREKGWIPDFLGSFRWRTPTGRTSGNVPLGTGFHGLQLAFTGVKVKDPVAFFGGLSYTANLPATQRSLKIDPGDTWGFNLGMGLALSYETSINISWEQRFTHRTKLEGDKVPGSALTVGTLRIGLTYALTKDTFIDFGVAIGLTRDASDVQATLAIPFRLPPLFSN